MPPGAAAAAAAAGELAGRGWPGGHQGQAQGGAGSHAAGATTYPAAAHGQPGALRAPVLLRAGSDAQQPGPCSCNPLPHVLLLPIPCPAGGGGVAPEAPRRAGSARRAAAARRAAVRPARLLQDPARPGGGQRGAAPWHRAQLPLGRRSARHSCRSLGPAWHDTPVPCRAGPAASSPTPPVRPPTAASSCSSCSSCRRPSSTSWPSRAASCSASMWGRLRRRWRSCSPGRGRRPRRSSSSTRSTGWRAAGAARARATPAWATGAAARRWGPGRRRGCARLPGLGWPAVHAPAGPQVPALRPPSPPPRAPTSLVAQLCRPFPLAEPGAGPAVAPHPCSPAPKLLAPQIPPGLQGAQPAADRDGRPPAAAGRGGGGRHQPARQGGPSAAAPGAVRPPAVRGAT
jgi:hypothetical protein